MAAGNRKKAGSAAAKEVKDPAKTKLILMIVGVVLVTMLVSALLTWILLSDSKESEADAAGAGVGQKALYLDLPPAFLVTLTHMERQRYLQVFVTVLTRDTRALQIMEQHQPLIRHELNLLFGEQDFETLLTDEGKQALRQKSTDLINELLKRESPGVTIEQVLFTNFVMQ